LTGEINPPDRIEQNFRVRGKEIDDRKTFVFQELGITRGGAKDDFKPLGPQLFGDLKRPDDMGYGNGFRRDKDSVHAIPGRGWFAGDRPLPRRP